MKLRKSEILAVKSIVNFVQKNPKLNKHFNMTYKTQKYTLEEIIPIIFCVLKMNISWRSTEHLKIAKNIHWNTIYKTHKRLIDLNVYKSNYRYILNKFYTKGNNKENLKVRLTDTTIIPNKLGIDKSSSE